MDRSLISAILLAAAIVLGGGGSSSPAMELALQLIFAALFVAWIALRSGHQAFDRSALALAALVLAIPAVQLIPLPPAIWQALPGRGIERDALALVDAGDSWMPWTMAPARTIASLLAMIVPVGLFLMVSTLDPMQRRRMLLVAVAGGLATAVLGALQLGGGQGRAWRIYADTHFTYVTGFFANRNAAADLLLIALLALAALATGERARRSVGQAIVAGAIAILMAIALTLTGSRMGIALGFPVALVAIAMLLAPSRGRGSRALLVTGSAIALALLALFATRIPAFQPVVHRFVAEGDERWKLWADTRESIAVHWPAGSGIGSFQPIFIAHERLEFVDPSMPVRAHNDWLEFTLEAGIAGWLALLAIAAMLVHLARQRLARSATAEERSLALFGLASLGVIALHSLVDYPLRSMTLACLAGLAAAMLIPLPGRSGRSAIIKE